MMLKMLLMVSAAFIATAAQGQSCSSYVNQAVQALSFEQAVARLPNIAPRGEFETTAQYEARRNAAIGSNEPLIVLKEPEQRDEHIRYDADAGRLGISAYAFDNTNFDAWRAFYGTPYFNGLNPSTIGNYDVVINQIERTGGTYVGQNAYGASWDITRVTRTIEAIYERERDIRDGISAGLFPEADRSPYVVGYLDMPPEIAQRMKPTLMLAFVVQPREPFVIRNEFDGPGRITIQNPFDVTYDATILIGDIQCGLVLDASAQVLAAYPTR